MFNAAQHRLDVIQPAAYWRERDERGFITGSLAKLFDTIESLVHGIIDGDPKREAETKQLQQLVTMTTEADAVVMRLRGQTVRTKGLPRAVGDFAAFIISAMAPKGLDFARYSIDYHYLRNFLYARAAWGTERAERQTPDYIKVLVGAYDNHGWLTKLDDEVKIQVQTEANRKK